MCKMTQSAVDLPDTRSAISTRTAMESTFSSTEPVSTTASSISGVPDFTEFKLDPFHLTADSGTPAPHRLQEARRSLSLHLEPCPDTAFAKSLKTFQEQSFTLYGPNQAHNSLPHIAVLGRVHIERGPDNLLEKWHAYDEFVSVVEQELKDAHLLPPPTFCGYEIIQRPSRGLAMRFRVEPAYAALVRRIEQRVADKCTAFDIRPMDRMHLGYNVLRPMSKETLKRIKDLAHDTIKIEIGGAWRLVLYEVMLESRVVGVQQQVSVINTWPVRPPSAQPSFASSFFLPMSLRVKLAVLSSWIRWNGPNTVDPNKRIKETGENEGSSKNKNILSPY